MAGGFPGAGARQAPYAEYEAWQPPGTPGGYPGPGGHGEVVNDGGYAYVIREDDLATPQSPRTRARERGQGIGEWSQAGAEAAPAPAATSGRSADGAGAYAGGVRAITAGPSGVPWPAGADGPADTAGSGSATTAARPAAPAGTADTTGDAADARVTPPAGAAVPVSAGGAADVDPALAYGPDDPAYGPSGTDWYKRDEEHGSRTTADTEESRIARGPFEPLSPSEREAAGHADYQPTDAAPALDDEQADQTEISDYQSVDDETSELLDFGTPTDPEAGALGRISDLYLAAETISPAGLDTHFDQLLERQRELISEYFMESGGLSPAEAAAPIVPAAPGTPAESPAPHGFDTAESLSGLLGELRNAP